MRLGIAKRFACEVEVFDGDKVIDKYITMEKDIDIKKSQKQKEQWRSYVLSKLDDEQNIHGIKDKDNG